MKAIFTTGLIAALLVGPALPASARGGCGYGAEAAVSKAGQGGMASTGARRSTVESEGVLTAQSDARTIREDENVRSGGARIGGSGAPAPGTTPKYTGPQ